MIRFTVAMIGVALGAGSLQWPVTQAPDTRTIAQSPDDFRTAAPEAWLPADSADSLYRLAREALNRSRYRDALQLFQQIRRDFPESGYVPDALYWEAFALYRLGTTSNLRAAVERLEAQKRRYPSAATRGDGEALLTRINSELARQGDADAQDRIERAAGRITPPTPPTAPTVAVPARAPRAGMGGEECDNEDEVRVMALHSLMQTNSERALPILRKVLARRDAASVCLRRHAMFVLSSRRDAESSELLIESAKSDPDPEVRQAAIFWLSQVNDERVVPILESVLQGSGDAETREAALFALAQRRDERSAQILRRYATSADTPEELRASAIMHLLQSRGGRNPELARQLFNSTTDPDTKTAILMMGGESNGVDREWLMSIATSRTENREVRQAALMKIGSTLSGEELVRLYNTLGSDDESGEMMFVLMMQRQNDPAVVAKMIDVARTSKNPELRQHAVMVLSQSRDPRATQYLAELLEQ